MAVVLDGEEDRRFRALELAYYGAWHAGLFSQQFPKGKFPKFEKHAPKRRKERGKAQSWQQMKAMAKALNAAFGGDVRRREDG